MILDAQQKWTIVIFMTLALGNPQFPMLFSMAAFPPMIQMMPNSSPFMVPILPPPPPPLPVPVPVPVPMPMGIAIVSDVTRQKSKTPRTTTTTTTECPSPMAVAIPMPMPMPMPIPFHPPMPPQAMQMIPPMPPPIPLPPPPVQFAIPGVIPPFCKKDRRHPNCPPCPPCSCNPCTPSFFAYCSPCHIKCRCKKGKNVPIPLPPVPPIPLPGPAFPMPFAVPPPIPGLSVPIPNSPNVVLIPFMPQAVPLPRRDKPRRQKCKTKIYDSSSSAEDSDYGNSDSDRSTESKATKKERIQYGIYRKSNRDVDHDHKDVELVKPELNYISNDGEVKIRKSLNKHDADMLMAEI